MSEGRIYGSTAELVGGTPLVKLSNIISDLKLDAEILAKVEYFNPSGSVKDRAALSMLVAAEQKGEIRKGGTVIEPTSGNTGIALAALCAAKGYKLIIVMPETMTEERRKLIKHYGAQLVLSDGSKGMKGAIEKAREINLQTENSIILSQFENPANPLAHIKTADEILKDTGGNIDIFIAGVGTGGTITGAGGYLKEQKPDIKVIAVEPESSPVLSGGTAGAHKIQGIGAGFVPDILDTKVYDGIEKISNEDAFYYARLAASSEGLAVGISSGAALAAAVRQAKNPENKGKTIVAILPDSADRYLSQL